MTAKRLIEHARTLLIHHELARFGIHATDMTHDVFKIADKSKRDLTNPIVVPEEELLEKYLVDNKVTNPNDRTFLIETFLGCIRHSKVIEATLKLFYEQTGGRYLQSEYYLFAVFTYLTLYRLDELGFPRYSTLIHCFDPTKTSRFIGFMFSTVNLEVELKKVWGCILDHQFLKEHIIDPVLRHVGVAQKLLEELCNRVDYGMVVKKSKKKVTESDPFVLTVPRPRRLPSPVTVIPTTIVSKPVPKSVYEGSIILQKLEKIKAENRAKCMQNYEESNKNQFKVVDRKPKARMAQMDTAQSQHLAIKPKPIPSTTHNPPSTQIKLTTSMILREDALIRKQQQQEQDKIAMTELVLRDYGELDTRTNEIKVKEQEDRILEIERKRLQVQLTHEEAYIAKQETVKQNREKAQQIQAMKHDIKDTLDHQHQQTLIENKKKIDTVHDIRTGIIISKHKLIEEKTKTAAEVAQETKQLLDLAQQQQQEELLRKTELIHQIRVLEKQVVPVGQNVKDVDLTVTSGLGLLSEMSISELQERLVLAKLRHQDDQDRKRQSILHHKQTRVQQLEQKLSEIDQQRQERRNQRMHKQIGNGAVERGVSVMSMRSGVSMASPVAESVKQEMLEKDVALKRLYDKIQQRKAARLATKSQLGISIHNTSSTPKLPSRPHSSQYRHDANMSRPLTAVSEKWDDLDEAERIYMVHRRHDHQHGHNSMHNVIHDSGIGTGGDPHDTGVPIVELRAM